MAGAEEVAVGEEVNGVRVLHCQWHLCIYISPLTCRSYGIFPLACRDMTPPAMALGQIRSYVTIKKKLKKGLNELLEEPR